jgi:hypothetical protein
MWTAHRSSAPLFAIHASSAGDISAKRVNENSEDTVVAEIDHNN